MAATKGADAARAELETRIKAGGDDFDYQIALAELNVGQNRTDDAVQALQKLANTAATPDKKLAAQVKLAEVYIAKERQGGCRALDRGYPLEGSPKRRRAAAAGGLEHR